MIFCGEQEIQQIKGKKGSGSWEKGDVYREGKTKKREVGERQERDRGARREKAKTLHA